MSRRVPDAIKAWQMIRPWRKDPKTGEITLGELKEVTLPVPQLGLNEALVEIAGCGVCHTDIGYFYEGVPTVTKPPLILGHEISGTVVAGPERLIGKEVIVPAVMPCHKCDICAMGRENRCLAQKMPGNSLGVYGGYASHIPVPADDLCIIEDRRGYELAELAVIADAITTPYQACLRAGLKEGDRAVVVGVGGVGSFVVQIAKAFGAKIVVAIDIDQERLDRALKYGADFAINSASKDPEAVRTEFRTFCKTQNVPDYGWIIFEVSGALAGQAIALRLLSFVGKIIWIGFNPGVNEYSLSRLMAFDAEIIGTWGCPPKHYPKVLQMVLDGKIQLRPFIELRPMSKIKDVFEEVHLGKLKKRAILMPDFH